MVTQLPDGFVEFRFYRPEARHVMLAGEFNGWHKSNLPMHMDKDGWWRYQLCLAPGCYQFRYVADGDWHTDYAAFGLEPGPFGLNSVVKVEPVSRTQTAPARAPVLRFPNSQTTVAELFDEPVPPDSDWSVDETEEELAAASA
jgi:1,4-alpha-glucan branching enzyme